MEIALARRESRGERREASGCRIGSGREKGFWMAPASPYIYMIIYVTGYIYDLY